jgi:AcrR family transcriptional regulator
MALFRTNKLLIELEKVTPMARPKSLEKRAKMIKGAKSLFLSVGYVDVSMVKISLESGVSKNTLYSHFPNKERLFRAVLENHWTHSSRPCIDPFDERDMTTVLVEFASKALQFLARKDTMAFFRILVSESLRFPKLFSTIIKDEGLVQTNITLYFSKKTNKDKMTIERIAKNFDALLTLDPLWYTLAGSTKRLSARQTETHIQHVVHHFVKTYDLI